MAGNKTPGKAVAPKRNVPAKRSAGTDLATISPLSQAMQQDAGLGMEMMQQGDLALPFILLLQAMSPQVTRGHEKHIKGAEAGDFFNTVTKEIYKGEEGLLVIPCHYEKVYNEWKPRSVGGGFVASSKTREEAERVKRTEPVGTVEVVEGNKKRQEPVYTDIVDTANHYILVQTAEGEWTEAVLSMTSTKLKASRQWNSKMKIAKVKGANGKFTPPSFARTYQITSTSAQNDKGVYYVPVINYSDWVDDMELYEHARNFRSMFIEQGRSLSYENADGTNAVDEELDEGEENF